MQTTDKLRTELSNLDIHPQPKTLPYVRVHTVMFVVNGQVDLNDPELEEPDLVSIGSDVSVNHARICAAGRPTTERDRERERSANQRQRASEQREGR